MNEKSPDFFWERSVPKVKPSSIAGGGNGTDVTFPSGGGPSFPEEVCAAEARKEEGAEKVCQESHIFEIWWVALCTKSIFFTKTAIKKQAF